MEALLEFFKTHLPWLIQYRYLFLFFGAVFEGLNTMVLGGFLASVGAVGLAQIFLLMTLGHTLNGYMWYSVGFFGGARALDKWGHRQKLSHEIIEKVTHYFNKYSGRAIVFTKFTFSFEIATLIMAGSLKYKLKDFSKYNFLGSLGWTFITFTIGYVFGQSFNLFRLFIRNITYFFVFLVGAIALVLILRLIINSAFIKSLKFEERIRKIRETVKDKLNTFLEDLSE